MNNLNTEVCYYVFTPDCNVSVVKPGDAPLFVAFCSFLKKIYIHLIFIGSPGQSWWSPSWRRRQCKSSLVSFTKFNKLKQKFFCVIMVFLQPQVNAQTRTLGGSVSKNSWRTEKTYNTGLKCMCACLFILKGPRIEQAGCPTTPWQKHRCSTSKTLQSFLTCEISFFYLTLLTDGSRFPVIPNCKSLLQLPVLHLLIQLLPLPLSLWVFHFQEHNRLI